MRISRLKVLVQLPKVLSILDDILEHAADVVQYADDAEQTAKRGQPYVIALRPDQVFLILRKGAKVFDLLEKVAVAGALLRPKE